MTMQSLANRPILRTSPFAFVPPRVVESQPLLPRMNAQDMDQARAMIREAEKVIQAQEERIRQLESMAMTDELTGLMNRRALMGALRKEIAHRRRDKRNVSLLIMIDLDGFKQVNDIYGHAVGDAYLQTVATVLQNEVRTGDYVARLGGDEFAVLMPQISAKDAATRLERLEKAFNNRVMHNRDISLPIRGSFGFSFIGEEETPESLMISADMKLYASKAQRRVNRNIGLKEAAS